MIAPPTVIFGIREQRAEGIRSREAVPGTTAPW